MPHCELLKFGQSESDQLMTVRKVVTFSHQNFCPVETYDFPMAAEAGNCKIIILGFWMHLFGSFERFRVGIWHLFGIFLALFCIFCHFVCMYLAFIWHVFSISLVFFLHLASFLHFFHLPFF